eukprot:86855-Chlamydomonas_euryale.AAC.3
MQACSARLPHMQACRPVLHDQHTCMHARMFHACEARLPHTHACRPVSHDQHTCMHARMFRTTASHAGMHALPVSHDQHTCMHACMFRTTASHAGMHALPVSHNQHTCMHACMFRTTASHAGMQACIAKPAYVQAGRHVRHDCLTCMHAGLACMHLPCMQRQLCTPHSQPCDRIKPLLADRVGRLPLQPPGAPHTGEASIVHISVIVHVTLQTLLAQRI